jgi:glycosyltransferase involved in cell wall biosynthesis
MALASPWSREIAAGLSALGHEVHAVDFGEPPNAAAYLAASDSDQSKAIELLRERGVVVHRINTRWRSRARYIAGAPALARIARSVDADIILTLYGGGFAILALASLVRPYAVYVVGSDVLAVRGFGRRIAGFALERAGRVFANGGFLAARTRELAPSAAVRDLCIGINPDAFAAADHDVAVPRAVITRGFLPVYNNQFLIEGLAARGAGLPAVPVVFVSKGPELDAVRSFADRALAPAQRSAVEFLGGVEWERLRDELRRSQIYVSLSTSDGTSVSLLEALATGLFPILSDIPQNREWVSEEAANGLLVPLNDAKALAEAIDIAVGDRALREKAASYNRRLVRERADARKNLALLAQDLAALAPAGRAGKQQSPKR